MQPQTFWTLLEAALPLSGKVSKADNGPSRCHRPTMFSTVLQLRAKNILELGVLFGESTLSLLLGAFVTEGEVHSVDVRSPMFVPPTLVASRWHFHASDTLAYLRNLPPDVSFDLVWLDDLHTYEHVKEEIRLLAPHLHSGSIVLLHDTMMGSNHEPDLDGSAGPNEGPDSAFWEDEQSSSAPHRYLETQSEWEWLGAGFNNSDFTDGGPYHALLDLPRDSWEWASVPTCFGMTLLRMKAGGPPRPISKRRRGADGYFLS